MRQVFEAVYRIEAQQKYVFEVTMDCPDCLGLVSIHGECLPPDSNIVDFSPLAECPFCGTDFRDDDGGGLLPWPRTARLWQALSISTMQLEIWQCYQEAVHMYVPNRKSEKPGRKRKDKKEWHSHLIDELTA